VTRQPGVTLARLSYVPKRSSGSGAAGGHWRTATCVLCPGAPFLPPAKGHGSSRGDQGSDLLRHRRATPKGEFGAVYARSTGPWRHGLGFSSLWQRKHGAVLQPRPRFAHACRVSWAQRTAPAGCRLACDW
jgi:hypothetical protein